VVSQRAQTRHPARLYHLGPVPTTIHPDSAINQAGHRIRVAFGPLGNPSIVTVIWPSLRHGHATSTVQQSRERDRLAVRDGQHRAKSDPGAGLKNDWVTALLVALQLVLLVLLLTGQIR
jgi:hypothetical protein